MMTFSPPSRLPTISRSPSNLWLFLTALAGLSLSCRDWSLPRLFFALWLAAGTVILYFHHPVWYHHVFLIAVPAAFFCGVFFARVTDLLTKPTIPTVWRRVLAGVVFATMLCLAYAVTFSSKENGLELVIPVNQPDPDAEALKIIARYQGPERTMVTSSHMLAFYSSSRVPPSLSVTSRKRFRAGMLDADRIVREIETRNIEQIVMDGRWKPPVRDKIEEAIKGTHQRVFRDKNNWDLEIFVRKDLVK